MFVDFEALF